VALRVDSFALQNPDIALYGFSVGASDGSWSPLCVELDGTTGQAIPLAGRWDGSQGTSTGGSWIDDPSSITLASTGYALAKCTLLGYRPWAGLRDHHETCTRLLRADYCGDGTSYTLDGRPIDLYDAIGIQSDTESWSFEAEWDAGGARCLSQQRVN